ncbi:MAG TPA: glycosyl transferase [Streptomyces sp.]|nr:glycosyl transferase [Streptomyces sp.]
MTALNSLTAAVTLWWMLHAWRTPATLEGTAFSEPDGRHDLTFSLLVPARHEEKVLRHSVERMLASDHPHFEIVVVTGHDDPGTTALARALTAEHPGRVRTVTDHHARKNKPRALNTALPECRGQIIGIFDAEDIVHPELLSHVDRTFRRHGADVVQGGVQLINYSDSWYALRNCLEYFFWFRSRLHLHARKGFVPLGGNTVFVRARLLRDTGGWDGDCLAEDCDLGVRLSSLGARIVVGYHPGLVTREETPGSLRGLYKQRTRWNQGFLQVLRKGEWRRLPTPGRRLLARYTLATPFLQAAAGLCLPPLLVVGLLDETPLPLAFAAWLPALLLTAMTAFECAALHDFGRQYGLRIGPVHYLKLCAGTPFYALVLAAAAVRAVWRECTGRTDWELTEHTGAHHHGCAPAHDRAVRGTPADGTDHTGAP